jgi:hypothetical protein
MHWIVGYVHPRDLKTVKKEMFILAWDQNQFCGHLDCHCTVCANKGNEMEFLQSNQLLRSVINTSCRLCKCETLQT